MSADDQILDHGDQAVARLAEIFKKDKIVALVRAFAERWQESETLYWDLLTKRLLDNAQGVQLDNLGRILDLERGTAPNDDAYRLLLKAQVRVLKSCGLCNDVLSVFNVAMDGTGTRTIVPRYPASFELTLEDYAVTWQLPYFLRFIRKSKGIGIKGELNYQTAEDALSLYTAIDTYITVGATIGQTSITVKPHTVAAAWPSSGSLIIDEGLSTEETVTYSAHGSTSFTISALTQNHLIGSDVALVGSIGLGLGDETDDDVGGVLAGASS